MRICWFANIRVSCRDKFVYSFFPCWFCFPCISLSGVCSATHLFWVRLSSPSVCGVGMFACVWNARLWCRWYATAVIFSLYDFCSSVVSAPSLEAHVRVPSLSFYFLSSFLPPSFFPPPSQHARRRKAIYDQRPMARRVYPFTSCNQTRASEIKRDKKKERERGDCYFYSFCWRSESPSFVHERLALFSWHCYLRQFAKSEVFNLTECLFRRDNHSCLISLARPTTPIVPKSSHYLSFTPPPSFSPHRPICFIAMSRSGERKLSLE